MVKNKLIFSLDLQLFADGGGDAGGTSGGEATGVTATAAAPQIKGVKSNPLAGVIYGKPDAAQNANVQTEAETPAPTLADRQKAYNEFIKSNKDLDDARVQNIVQNRLKSTKETVDKYNQLQPVLEALYGKHGIKDGDIEALVKAVNDDESYFEQEALEKGIPVEAVREMHRLKRENADVNAELQKYRDADEQRRAEQIFSEWIRQGEALKEKVPDFDFDTEMQNPQFRAMLRDNIDVEGAFFALHGEDLMAGAMRFAADKAGQKLANNIAANGARPSENGLSDISASTIKSDVSQLSKADIREIQRRVGRGEQIRF